MCASLSGRETLPRARPPRPAAGFVARHVARQFPVPVGSCHLHVTRHAGGRACEKSRSSSSSLRPEGSRLRGCCCHSARGRRVPRRHHRRRVRRRWRLWRPLGPWEGRRRACWSYYVRRDPRGCAAFRQISVTLFVALKRHRLCASCTARYNGPMR
jgi:hypothetical protein